MKIGFIGAGKVGTSFGIYLMSNKVDVVGYYSKSLSSSNKAAFITNSKAYTNIYDLVKDVDLVAITTSDDVIINIVKDLNKHGELLNNKVVFHMSGVHSSSILTPLKDKNVTILSLHPLLSFKDSTNSVEELKNAFFTIEGYGDRFEEIKESIEKLGNQLIVISAENKVLYHTACSVLSNYLVTLIDVGLDMLAQAGFSKQEAIQLAKPLVFKTLNNIFQSNTEEALTGPISRGDIGTVTKHIENLNNNNNEWLKLYKVLGEHTIDLTRKSNRINQDTAISLMEVMKDNE